MRLILLALLTCCGGSSSTPVKPASTAPESTDPWAKPSAEPAPEFSQVLARYGELNARVCRCTDNDCLDRVTDERNRLGYEMKTKYSARLRWTPEEEAKAAQLTEEYLACARRIVKPEPGRPRASEVRVLRPMADFRDQMCACPDRVCIQRVSSAMAQYFETVAHIPLDDGEEARAKTIGDETTKCALRPHPP